MTEEDRYEANLTDTQRHSAELSKVMGDPKNASIVEKLLAGDKEARATFDALASRVTGVEQPTAQPAFLPSDTITTADLLADDARERLPQMSATASADHVTPSPSPHELLGHVEGWRQLGYTDSRIVEMNDPDRAYPQWLHERAREVMVAARDNLGFFAGMSAGAIGKMVNAAATVSTGRVVPNGTPTRYVQPGWENPRF